MTTYIETNESDDFGSYDDGGFDEREAAALRTEEEALNWDPWRECDYDPDSDDIELD